MSSEFMSSEIMSSEMLYHQIKHTFSFVARCPQCDGAGQYSLDYLGLPVRCSDCNQTFEALDKELESAAMDEEVTEYAKVLDWQEEPVVFEPRPR